MRFSHRLLVLPGLLIILLVFGIGIATSTKKPSRPTSAAETVDCADDCKSKRDKTLEKCDGQPDAVKERCRELASKQYDQCLERCQSGKP